MFTEVQNGKGAVVAVTGATGTGKTALLQAITERVAGRDGSCFTVTASASERPHPYALLDQLVKVLCVGGMADPEVTGSSDQRAGFLVFEQVYQAIHEFAETRPVLIGIDDVHFADDESLQLLGYLVRRVAWSPVLMVVNGTSSYERELAALNTEMLHLSHCHRVRLAPLTGPEVAEQLTTRLGATPDRAVAEFCADTTGGVPLLLQALLDDGGRTPRPGASFRQAVQRSLHRCEPQVAAVARAMAVLGAGTSSSLVAEFLGADLPLVQAGLVELRAMGLLSWEDFRHEQTRLAVLASVPQDELPELRGRAAELLYHNGAPAGTVADQLMAAPGQGEAAWAGPIAREAARDAMAAGDVTRAVAYLRHAVRFGSESDRVATTVQLADAQWHADPGTAGRHVDDLVRDARAGRLAGTDALVPINQLLWWGRDAEADELARMLAVAYGWPIGEGDCTVPVADICRTLLWTIFRRATAGAGGGEGGTWPEDAVEVWSGPMVAVLDLTAVAAVDHAGAAATQADLLLRGLRAGSPVTPALHALVLLVQTGRLAEAVRWADRLLEEEWIRRVPMRRVMFEMIRAVAALRQGEPGEALRRVGVVLDLVPPASWGIVAGLPLGLAVRAATECGDVATARSYLNFPLPAEMFDTPFALPYLQALGRYHDAMGHPRTAQSHFQTCVDQMVKWTGSAGPGQEAPPTVIPAPRRPMEDAPPAGAELTDAELRVAALAAAGDTNRQIARKLFITVSTVEQHLTKVYRKLNVHSRAALSTGLPDFRS